jgi:hypothetical protein
MNDKQRMDTVRENLERVRSNIDRMPGISDIGQQNDCLYVAVLKAKEAAVYLLDLESVRPNDTIKSVLLTIDKLALAMSESKKEVPLKNAALAIQKAITLMPKVT